MDTIYNFLVYIYKYIDVSYNTLKKYIVTIWRLYEYLALIGKPLDNTLYIPKEGSRPRVLKAESKVEPLTKIIYLKNKFMIKKNNAWLRYTKWYTPAQYRTIAERLPLVHRIIFLLTIYYGYRCSTALSIKLSSINMKTKEIRPTHSKTKQLHTSLLTAELLVLIRSYLENERSRNPGSSSDWLFLNNRGEQMSRTPAAASCALLTRNDTGLHIPRSTSASSTTISGST